MDEIIFYLSHPLDSLERLQLIKQEYQYKSRLIVIHSEEHLRKLVDKIEECKITLRRHTDSSGSRVTFVVLFQPQ